MRADPLALLESLLVKSQERRVKREENSQLGQQWRLRTGSLDSLASGSLARDDVGVEAGSIARDDVGVEHSLSLPPVTLSEATRSVAESKGPIRFGTTVPTAARHTGADKLLPYDKGSCRARWSPSPFHPCRDSSEARGSAGRSARWARVSAGEEQREKSET